MGAVQLCLTQGCLHRLANVDMGCWAHGLERCLPGKRKKGRETGSLVVGDAIPPLKDVWDRVGGELKRAVGQEQTSPKSGYLMSCGQGLSHCPREKNSTVRGGVSHHCQRASSPDSQSWTESRFHPQLMITWMP